MPSLEQAREVLKSELDTVFSWVYKDGREELLRLYEMGKRDQWNATTQLPWETPVDLDDPNFFPAYQVPIYGSEIWEKMTQKEQRECTQASVSWVYSQFLHGEQGALLATSQIVNTVPSMAAKLYGSTQVVDEGRHVEVFSRYLHEKLGMTYRVNTHLAKLLNLILTDPRWDMKYLGMQVLVEGLALGAFHLIHNLTEEPLVKKLLEYVCRDESRHVAFGVLALQGIYDEMSDGERKEREEFAFEACQLMRDRFLGQEVWEDLGLPVDTCCEYALTCENMQTFRTLLFSRVIPNLKRLGLLSPRMRSHYENLGVLQFENQPIEELKILEEKSFKSERARGECQE